MSIAKKCQEQSLFNLQKSGRGCFYGAVRFAALFLTVLLLAVPAMAAQDSCSVSWRAFAVPGKEAGPAFLALWVQLTPSPGVYYYAAKAKEGLPTKVVVKEEGKGAPAYSVLLPNPVRKKASRLAGVSAPGVQDGNTLIYDGPSVFLVKIPVREYGVRLNLEVSGLLCSAKSCTPFRSREDIAQDMQAVQALPDASGEPWWAAFASYAFDPKPFAWKGSAPAKGAVNAGQSLGNDKPLADFSKEIPLASGGEGAEAASVPDFSGEMPLNGADGSDGQDLAALMTVLETITPRYDKADLEVGNLATAIFFGLIAGLLLNLMPCVLPVISLKFSALLAVSAMSCKEAQAKHFREHNLIFGAGIITWFLVLALLLGGAGLAWGELFQSPYVITGLAILLFLLGLSLFGVFSLPVLDLKFANSKYPRWQAFASGLLATLLATPCSGPLLGGVLGWALRQPLPVLTASVVSVGFGMALPYGILALYPGLVHLLPRPGNWTLRLEQLLGFFLMASVIYLVTLLPPDWLGVVLANLFIVAFAAWLWGQIGHLRASPLRRAIARGLAIALVVLGAWWGVASSREDFTWEKFDQATFVEDFGKEPMLVEFTADWCASCKAMEQTTLNAERMREIRSRYNIRMIRVDLTHNDEAGQELLKSLGSASIPVIALFPQGADAKKPLVLRDLVTPSQLEEALAQIF